MSDARGSNASPMYRELFWTTIRALQELGGSGSRQEIAAKAAELGGYSEAEQAELMPNGRTTKIAYRVGRGARSFVNCDGNECRPALT